jgi:hypothetical protein
MRRIKSVSLTVPCVTGPYTNVDCTLTLLASAIRVKPAIDPQPDYEEQPRYISPMPVDGEDQNARYLYGAIESIKTSNAVNDYGLFEPNLRDERYLPFEGAGVISRWKIELPKQSNHFAFSTISDVILHISYTARSGGDVFKKTAIEFLSAPRQNLARLISVKHELPDAWHAFMNPPPEADEQILEFSLDKDRFPFRFQNRDISVTKLNILLLVKTEDARPSMIKLDTLEGDSDISVDLLPSDLFGKAPHATFPRDEDDPEFDPGPFPYDAASGQKLKLTLTSNNLRNLGNELTHDVEGKRRLDPEVVEDLILIARYDVIMHRP